MSANLGVSDQTPSPLLSSIVRCPLKMYEYCNALNVSTTQYNYLYTMEQSHSFELLVSTNIFTNTLLVKLLFKYTRQRPTQKALIANPKYHQVEKSTTKWRKVPAESRREGRKVSGRCIPDSQSFPAIFSFLVFLHFHIFVFLCSSIFVFLYFFIVGRCISDSQSFPSIFCFLIFIL